MTIVKELNNLAEKMTGDNPKARTDAQAVKYISDNYSGGGSGGGSEPLVFNIENAVNAFYNASQADTEYILDTTESDEFLEIRTALLSNPNQLVYLDGGEGLYTLANSYTNEEYQLVLSATYNSYYQGVVSVVYIYIGDGSVWIASRDYTR